MLEVVGWVARKCGLGGLPHEQLSQEERSETQHKKIPYFMQYRRAKTPGATYFLTVVTHNRHPKLILKLVCWVSFPLPNLLARLG